MPPLPAQEDEHISEEEEEEQEDPAPTPGPAADPRTVRLNRAGVLAVRSPRDYGK